MGIARLFTQSVAVETLAGSAAGGSLYAAATSKACFVNDSVKQVRDGRGQEVVSTARLYGPLADADAYTPGSRVTVNGRPHEVIVCKRLDAAGPASSHHIEVELT